MSRDARAIVRAILPSHIELGSEGVHQRPLTESTMEDYATPTVGGNADMGDQGNQVWPGDPTLDIQQPADLEESFLRAAGALNDYTAGALQDDKAVELFNVLVRTGLIEYMNDQIRDTAQSLARAGYMNVQVAEAEFTRDVGGQQAQAGTPNIQVRSATMYKQAGPTAPISTAHDVSSQPAQSGPAQVPSPPGGQVTTLGHDAFPDSGGSAEDPAKIPKAAGTQKAGPNHGDGMSGGHGGINVGNSLQQHLDPDADKGDYEGSKVGHISEVDGEDQERRVPGATCPVIPPDFEDDIYGTAQPRRERRPQRKPRKVPDAFL